MTNHAIETFDVEHAFEEENVLRGLSITVPRGSVYGLLGRNGSGKTTLIRILLGALRARAGRCRVLGLDPARDTISIRSRVGYVPQESDLVPFMDAEETLRFLRSFYPETWRDFLAEELLERFEVPRRTAVSALSGGQKARLALVCALAFEPEVLILDEPTAGLDAVVRRDFVETIIELIAREGCTVLLSSHLLNEVELLADRVAIVEHGRLLVESSVEDLKTSLRRLTARFEGPPDRSRLPGLVSCRRLGERWQLAAWARSEADRAELSAALDRQGATDVSADETSLESIFVDLVGRRNDG